MHYNIILLVDGTLSLEQANQVEQKHQKLLEKATEFKSEYLGLKELAYPIKKQLSAHYYRWSFHGESNCTKEFKRAANINKQIIRELIINREKDYGYLGSVNPKKQQLSLQKLTKYNEIIASENNPDNPDAPVTSGLASVKPRLSRVEKQKERELEKWTVVHQSGNFDTVQINPYRPRIKRFLQNNQQTSQANNNQSRFQNQFKKGAKP